MYTPRAATDGYDYQTEVIREFGAPLGFPVVFYLVHRAEVAETSALALAF